MTGVNTMTSEKPTAPYQEKVSFFGFVGMSIQFRVDHKLSQLQRNLKKVENGASRCLDVYLMKNKWLEFLSLCS